VTHRVEGNHWLRRRRRGREEEANAARKKYPMIKSQTITCAVKNKLSTPVAEKGTYSICNADS
jgi:hypothetical protein